MARSPGRPEALDRATLIGGALRIIDRDGIAALTMRRLATELSVSPMAPYRHVSSKEELLRVVAAEVVARIEVPTGACWHAELEQFFEIFRDRLLDHPGVAGLFAGTTFLSEVVYEVSEPILASLLAAEFDPDTAVSIFLACASCAIGSAVLASGIGYAPADASTPEPPSARRYPAVATIFEYLPTDPERRHTAGLRAIIAGFAAAHPSETSRPGGSPRCCDVPRRRRSAPMSPPQPGDCG